MKLKNVPSSKLVTIAVRSFENGMNGKTEENVLPLATAKELINLSYENGALKPGVGVENISLESEQVSTALAARIAELSCPSKIYHFRRVNESGERADYLVFFDSGSLIAVDLFCPQNENIVVWSGLAEEPLAVCYNLDGKDVVLFTFSLGSMIVWDGAEEAYLVADAPAISSMTLHYERLFATSTKTEQNTVWFSDDLDPTNWSLSLDEAGYIQMTDERGAAQKVVSFLDYVYVFREYGIARISGYGDQTQFLVSQLSCQTGKIFPQTVTLVGDRILFLAEDGIYSFNGLSATKILSNINPYFDGCNNQNAVAAAGEGKWFLLCKMMLQNDNQQKEETDVLVTYDTTEKKALVSKELGIVSLCALRLPFGSKVLAIVDKSKAKVWSQNGKTTFGGGTTVGEITKNGKLFSESLVGVWQTGWTDIGYSDSDKIIRKVSLASSNMIMTVETERAAQTFNIGGSTLFDSHLLSLRGKKVRFSLSGKASDAYSSDLRIVAAIAEK